MLAVAALVAKFLGFASKMLLTRVLLDRDIGLMVMILALAGLFEVLTEVGIKQSVIQHKDGAEPEYLNMAWWFQSCRGFGLYLAGYLLAPFVCSFYFKDKPDIISGYAMADLVTMVRVAFLTIALNGLISPRAHVLEREFRFGKAAIIIQGGFILGTIVTIVLALIMRNVWAIAIGTASTSLFRCLLSYMLCPFIPRLQFHRESLRGLCRFARGMIGLPLLTYIAFNVDVLVAGKLALASLVGYYGMARVLAMTPRDLFARIISPVVFPAFAEKQNDKVALRTAVLKLTQSIAIILLPAVALGLVCGEIILAFVYGSEYGTVWLAFGALCISVTFLIQGGIIGSVFFGIGQPEKHRAFVASRALVLLVLIYPATKLYDVSGAAVAVLAACSVALCMQVIMARRTIGLRLRDYLTVWLPGLFVAIPVGLIGWGYRAVRSQWGPAYLVLGTIVSLALIAGVFVWSSRSDREPLGMNAAG